MNIEHGNKIVTAKAKRENRYRSKGTIQIRRTRVNVWRYWLGVARLLRIGSIQFKCFGNFVDFIHFNRTHLKATIHMWESAADTEHGYVVRAEFFNLFSFAIVQPHTIAMRPCGNGFAIASAAHWKSVSASSNLTSCGHTLHMLNARGLGTSVAPLTLILI